MCHLRDNCRVKYAENHECRPYHSGALHVVMSVGRQLPEACGIEVEVAGKSEVASQYEAM